MKKLLLSLLAVVGLSFAAAADSYTIEFKGSTNTNPPSITAKVAVANVVLNGAEYVESFSDFTQAYYNAVNGIKIGSNKNAGAITINLSETGKVNATKIEVYAYASKNPTYQKLEINGTQFDFENTDETVFTVSPNQEISTIVLKKTNASNTSSQQGFISVSKIIVTYGEGGNPSTEPSITVSPKNVDFFALKGESQQKTVNVTLANIEENVTASVDNAAFTISATSFTPAQLADGIVVTYTGVGGITNGTLTLSAAGVSATVALEGATPAHAGTETDPFSVSDVLLLNNTLSGKYYVTGVIGDKWAATAVNGMVTETGTVTNSNIILKEGDKMIGVALPSGDTRTILNIKDHPSNVGQTVVVNGTLEAYFSAPGVKNTTYVSGLSSELKSAGLAFSVKSISVVLGEDFEQPEFTKATTADVTFASSDESVATIDATGAVTIVGLGTTTITATSPANDEYDAGTASYTITVSKKYATVSEFYEANGTGIIGFDLIVTYVNESYVYAVTESGEATLIYKSNTGLKAGDVVPAGWTGKYSPYNGLPEISPVGALPEVTETAAVPEPTEVTSLNEADINKIVILKNVVFATATSGTKNANFTGTITPEAVTFAEGDEAVTTIQFRNTFTTSSVEAGTYDVKAAVGFYSNEIKAYPIEYTESTTTGIEGIVVDENAPVEYFNLQGVRVANPENGLYIRRQGNKATKVLVK